MVKVSTAFNFNYMVYLLKWAVSSAWKLLSFVFNDIVCNLYFKIVIILLLLEAGDIELNPGPNTINNSLSILHSNIKSIRNKVIYYITENLLDSDLLCFTESHLDANVTTASLIMSSEYDIRYRKDRTNHCDGLIMYLSCELAHTRVIGSLHKNIEKAPDTTNNIVILGDMNEDLLNPNMHNLKEVLLLNSIYKTISEPTRQLALLDPFYTS